MSSPNPPQGGPPDLPADLPPEYAEAYRRAYERAYRDALSRVAGGSRAEAEEPAPDPLAETDDGGSPGATHRAEPSVDEEPQPRQPSHARADEAEPVMPTQRTQAYADPPPDRFSVSGPLFADEVEAAPAAVPDRDTAPHARDTAAPAGDTAAPAGDTGSSRGESARFGGDAGPSELDSEPLGWFDRLVASPPEEDAADYEQTRVLGRLPMSEPGDEVDAGAGAGTGATATDAEPVTTARGAEPVADSAELPPHAEPLTTAEPAHAEPVHAAEPMPAAEPAHAEPVHGAEPMPAAEPAHAEPVHAAEPMTTAEPAHRQPVPDAEPVPHPEPAPDTDAYDDVEDTGGIGGLFRRRPDDATTGAAVAQGDDSPTADEAPRERFGAGALAAGLGGLVGAARAARERVASRSDRPASEPDDQQAPVAGLDRLFKGPDADPAPAREIPDATGAAPLVPASGQEALGARLPGAARRDAASGRETLDRQPGAVPGDATLPHEAVPAAAAYGQEPHHQEPGRPEPHRQETSRPALGRRPLGREQAGRRGAGGAGTPGRLLASRGDDAHDRPAWLVPAILAGLVVVLLLGAFLVGRVVASSVGSADVAADPADEGVDIGDTGSAGAEAPKPQKSRQKPAADAYRGPTQAATVTAGQASCQAPPSVDAAGNRVSYPATNAFDEDASTAWRCTGDGVGETLTVELADSVEIGEVGLVPGYAKTDPRSGVDRYAENRRITKVLWTFDDGTTVVQDVDGSKGNRALQTLRIPPVTTRSVELTILDSTGARRNTVAVSEVRFGATS